MAINLKTLLNTAPLKDEDRADFLSRFDTLTDDQKIRLSELCWKMLSQKYHAQVKLVSDQLMNDVALGKKEFNKQEFDDIKKQYLHELLKKLEATESENEIEIVRRELAKHQQLTGSADYSKQ